MTTWKELLKELNLTIREFAETYDIPYNTVRQWCNGSRTAPPYIKKMIEKIIELNINGKQLNFLENLDEEFLQYEKIMQNYGTVTPQIIIWNGNNFVELRKRNLGIVVEYGNATNTTIKKLENEKELKRMLDKIFNKTY